MPVVGAPVAADDAVMPRMERHRLGPRLHVAGHRVHEWHVGALVLAVVALGLALDLWRLTTPVAIVVVVGAWLVAKDWQDLFRSRRDTTSWSIGFHRRRHALRRLRRADQLPLWLAVATGVVGVMNLASALTPGLRWRRRLVLDTAPFDQVPVLHAMAVPAGAALLVLAVYLARRRQRAWQVAFALALLLTALNVLKGLDIEEALVTAALAAILWWARDAFYVRHQPLTLRSSAWRIPAIAAGAIGLAAVAVWASARPHPTPGLTLRTTFDLLFLQPAPLHFTDEFSHLPLAVALVGAGAALAGAYVVFRPIAAPRSLPGHEARRVAARLVHAYGTDTLSFFKLRLDEQYLFAPDERAFAGYRVKNRVLLVSGDPVGAASAMPALVERLVTFSEEHGLRLAVIGAGEDLLELWQQAGLRATYLGDEAIVETAAFTLQGHAIKKVRQAVNRVERSGYTFELRTLGTLDETHLRRLEEISAAWRRGAPERGFSMALDAIGGEHQRDSVVALARDGDGEIRGFLHLVPSYGRPAMSLSFMRREAQTPNGLTEFLIVRAIDALRERGVQEVSLNFAAFARLMHDPKNIRERVLGRLLALANPFFQIESLYRFNAKFFPRWEPRFLVYEGSLGLPRTGLAALRVEGHLPAIRGGRGPSG
jgi:lysyl-tRNA synthetase class 2